MNSSKPEWYREIKHACLPAMRFDEAMKENVIKRIAHQSGSKRISIQRIGGIAAFCSLLVIVGFSSVFLWPQQELHKQQGTGEGIELPYRSLAEATELQIINPRHRSSLQRVPLSSVEVKKAYSFDGIGQYMIYTRPEEDSFPPYDGLILEEHASAKAGDLLEYGIGGLSEVELVHSEAFGEFDYRLSGTCGPYVFCSRWFRLDGGEVISELQLNSPAYEHDLDGDGTKEIVLVGTSYYRERVYVLKSRNENIEVVDLNAVLQIAPPDKLIYDEINQLFQVWVDGNLERIYRYAPTGDKLLPLTKSNSKES